MTPEQRAVAIGSAQEIAARLTKELAGLAPQFIVRARELEDAVTLNVELLLDGSIDLARAEANLRKVGEALKSELLVATYRAKASAVSFTLDTLAVVLKMAVALLVPV